MKKLFVLALLCVFACTSYAQNVEEVWLLLKNQNVPGAKKKIEECMPTNQDNWRAWLYRGNVYLQVYNRDEQRKKKDPAYVSKTPDAIYIAYESFYKSLEINPNLEPIEGIIDPTQGQISCGGPLYNMGFEAYGKGDYDNTVKYLTAAIKCLNLASDPELKQFVGFGYYYLADITLKQKGDEAYAAVLDDAMKAKPGMYYLYQMAYDVAFKANDMDKCGKIINSAKKNVVKDEKPSVYSLELGYASSINDTARFNKAMEKVRENISNAELVGEAATYLVNANNFDDAIALLNACYEKSPNEFAVNNMLGYAYYMQSVEFGKQANAATDAMDWDKQKVCKDKQNAAMEEAHNWCDKAFNIKKTDVQNALMLKQLKLYLGKEVPAELNEVCKQAGQ